jgi:DNA-binding response OmpR family regulator
MARADARRVVVVVSRDKRLTTAVKRVLERAGYGVREAGDEDAAVALQSAEHASAIVVDDACREVDARTLMARVSAVADLRSPQCTVIALIGAWSHAKRFSLMAAGLSDYVRRSPLDGEDLLARLEAAATLHRRRVDPISAGPVTIDPDLRRAWCNGVVLPLTPTEFRLLHCLVRNAGHVVSLLTIARDVWGHDGAVHSDTYRVYIRLLRKHLAQAGQANLIQTVHGQGYLIGRLLLAEHEARSAASSPPAQPPEERGTLV